MNNPLADLFPPIPQKFLDILLKYGDKEGSLESSVFGGAYLKRFAELGILDLRGLCNELNYIFFANKAVLTPDIFGEYNVNEIVDLIKEKSILGSML